MRIRPLSKGDKGEDVQWLKSWLNQLVAPSPELNNTTTFDDDTATAVQLFKVQNNILPISGTADMHVVVAIWQQSSLQLTNTTMFGSPMRFDRTIFLDHFFTSFSTIKSGTVKNLLNVLAMIEWDSGFQVKHVPWVAYMLATMLRETALTFAPVAEGGCNDRTGCSVLLNKDGTVRNTRAYGNPLRCPNLAKPGGSCPADPANGAKTHTYYGRGYVQLTHFGNYQATSKALYNLGLLQTEDQLLHFPEKVMEENIAYSVISVGMRDNGSFFSGGKTFKDFINVDHQVTPARRLTEYVAARQLVNGNDSDTEIADNAVKFEALLNVSRHDAPTWRSIRP